MLLDEFLALNVYAFLLIFTRVGTALTILPAFGQQQVNMRSRLAIALALTFVLTPLLTERLPAMPGSPWMLGALILGEFLAGAIIGTIGLILASAVQVAGTVTSFVSGLANALIFDPISQQQSAIVAGFLSNIAILLLFVTETHHLMIRAIVDSYGLFEPGTSPLAGDVLEVIVRNVSATFKIGVQMATPFVVAAFGYYVVLGVMTRLAPQIPVFFIGMPLQIVMALAMMIIVVSSIMLIFINFFRDGLAPFLSV